MKTKILIILLIVVCLLSCTACNILDMASQTTARSNAEVAMSTVLLLNNDAAEHPMYFLVFGDKEINYVYYFEDSKLKLYNKETPVVEYGDLVYTNPDPKTLDYDYSACQSVTTNEDIVRNILVLVKMN